MDALVQGEPLITGRAVSLKLGNRVILDAVDIEVMPGAIVTTRIPIAANSRATGNVSATMPPFEAAYAGCPI